MAPQREHACHSSSHPSLKNPLWVHVTYGAPDYVRQVRIRIMSLADP